MKFISTVTMMLDIKFKASELIYKCAFSNEIFVKISSQKAKLANPKSDRMYSNQQKAVSLLRQILKLFLAKHLATARRSGMFHKFH